MEKMMMGIAVMISMEIEPYAVAAVVGANPAGLTLSWGAPAPARAARPAMWPGTDSQSESQLAG